jgi:hypothetical protein
VVAPQQIIKKTKGQGFLHITYKTVSFTIRVNTWVEFGVLFGVKCELSVKIGKTIARKENLFGINFKVTIVKR